MRGLGTGAGGAETPQEAAALVVAHLPGDCGPADEGPWPEACSAPERGVTPPGGAGRRSCAAVRLPGGHGPRSAPVRCG
ncbi:DUF6193 family natural product biosynthesis protein [Streptomyces sp. NPDC048612]|uniref:DUF6193 family natural product biosynthesis protein n=1 Tax=Streptomyces sp. NPDC048612 TaxID=3365579 RepID=UPI003713D1E3